MPGLPAVNTVSILQCGDLIVTLTGRPHPQKLARLVDFIQRRPGVKSASTAQKIIYVEPTEPTQTVALLAALTKILKPRRSINVHLHFGLSATETTDFANRQTICAVEFVLPTAPEVVNGLCEQVIHLVEHYKGSATLVACHEKFFVIKFKDVKRGRGLKEILYENLGLALSLELRLNTAKDGLTAEEAAVANLLELLG